MNKGTAAVTTAFCAILVSGCASHPDTIIDMQGVDESALGSDWADCQSYSDQVIIARGAAKGAAVVGAAAGAISDNADSGAEYPSATIRFRLIRDLSAAGVPVSLLMAPIIPAINDTEIEAVLSRAADAGATHAAWILLRLPHELKQIFVEWLQTHMPDRAGHVMSLLRQASGGKDYDNRFGVRQRGRGPYASMINQRFTSACRRYGIRSGRYQDRLDCTQFRPPAGRQMTLAID